MATDIAVAAVSGIFLNNEVFNLEGAIKSAALSVAKFSTVGSSSESVASVLSFIYELIEFKFTKHDWFIFLGSSAWQQNTRIIRHRKLRGALKCRGLEIAEGGGWQEHAIEAEGKIRFFGGLKGKGDRFI
ncbi:hypothetical protein UG46_03315 [Pseudomonas fluorescens]|nr:hypothetical protein [Pseudomonas fluorescens]KJH87858.1 hypothetical protein UG46_03315 [Pseudomonas fluorescens]